MFSYNAYLGYFKYLRNINCNEFLYFLMYMIIIMVLL